ncbi:MAG: adenosylcobalamin-dependent ribonucleoside-diphosphate reductase [Candidatus Woesearchaeota archaeon]
MVQDVLTKSLDWNTQDVELVKTLQGEGVPLTGLARSILNNSTHLKEMGLIIFLDRYALKDRSPLQKGDLVVAVSKDHPKYPKKDLGVIVDFDGDFNVKLRMITGMYKDGGDLLSVAKKKCDKPVESIYEAYARVARAVASVEEDDVREEYEVEFRNALLNGYIQPAGRIMAGANVDEQGQYTSNLTLYNCYVLPSPRDSRGSIVRDTLYQMVEIMSRGGGAGINLSTLRPRYAHVKGVNGKSSGAVSWGNLYSNATGLIEQGGSRRGALMLMLADWHPDVEEFIASKHKIGFLDNANISVLISDEFMDALKRDAEWNLEFPDLDDPETKKLYDTEWDGDLMKWKRDGRKTAVFKTVRARDLWEKLIGSAWKSAEPGIVFIGRYNDFSNSWYYNPIICTNPCGEQGLPPWGVCNLGHLALNNFVYKNGEDEIGPLYDFDWEALESSTKTLVRFLDDVIDLTPYIFEENRKNQLSERRVGCGTLGLAEVLIRMRLRFGSDEADAFIDKLYEQIAVTAYEASIALAEEKGSFEKFDAEKFLQSAFMKQMPEEVREKVREYGIRNVTLTTQAPTGTVGSMLGTSTGIEPFFAFKYYQQSRLGFHEIEIDLAKDYKRADGTLPDFFVSAMELGPRDHIKVQATIQKWTDSSISKTANVPAEFTVKDTMDLYEYAYDLGCKGVTIYRDGSRDEQILSTDKDTEKKNAEDKGSGQSVPDDLDTSKSSSGTLDPDVEEQEVVYGAEVGNTCPNCKEGKMVKLGGCTECSAGCGFKGGCDMK